MSCPSRGTWIEICPVDYEEIVENVVPHTGHVDLNVGEIPDWAADTDVVPLTGHVDRNCMEKEAQQ